MRRLALLLIAAGSAVWLAGIAAWVLGVWAPLPPAAVEALALSLAALGGAPWTPRARRSGARRGARGVGLR
jgi:hypothetical protein